MKIKTMADVKLLESTAKKLTTFLEDEEFAVSTALEYCFCDRFRVDDFLAHLESVRGVKCSYVPEMCISPMCHGVMHSGYISCESPNGSIHMSIYCERPVWKSLKFSRI